MAARGVAGKDVFVSYGREESVKEFVRKLKKDLETEKLSVWLDVEDIPTGREWPKEIGIALRECKALIAVVTRKYVSSEYCKSELYVARGNKKPIFPLIREDGWDESDDSQGVNFMIAASNWAMFRPVDDYGLSLQSLVAGLKGIEGLTEQGMVSDWCEIQWGGASVVEIEGKLLSTAQCSFLCHRSTGLPHRAAAFPQH